MKTVCSTSGFLVRGWDVRIEIYDGAAYRGQRVSQLYDARLMATCSAGSGSFIEALPLMLGELFEDFPGENGKSMSKYIRR
jgi:hypothetical protein